jgi:uncharacterized protein YjbI with pentapeptide repeats
MAFNMFLTGKDYLPSTIIENKITPVKQLMKSLGDEVARDTLKTMYISFYFREVGMERRRGYRQDEDDEYGIEFVHKSFSEFLVAEYIYRKLKEDFLGVDNYGDLLLNNEEKTLEAWCELMAQRPFSREIIDYLIQLIANDPNKHLKKELKDRMRDFAPYFFEHGFLPSVDARLYEVPAIERAVESFYGWVLLCGYLNDEVFILEQLTYFEKLIYYLRMVTLSSRRLKCCGANFQGVNLSGANFFQANFFQAKFTAADLSRAHLTRAYLSGADFSGTYLSGAYLCDANLNGANLNAAYLFGADLSGANLSGAYLVTTDLNRAYLRRTYFNNAVLKAADLKGAHLNDAYLFGADLTDADFTGADLGGVKGINMEQLLTVKSLYNCKNLAPALEAQLRAAKPCLFTPEGCPGQ